MSEVTLKIEEKVIADQIKDLIHAQVLGVFSDKSGDFMSSFVNSVMSQKVNYRGEPSSYSHDKNYLAYLAETTIKKGIEDSIKDWMEQQKPAIDKLVKKNLNAKKSKLIDQIVNEITKGLSKNFYSTVHVQIGKAD